MNNKIIGYVLLIIGICTFVLALILVFKYISNTKKEKFVSDNNNNSDCVDIFTPNNFKSAHDLIMQTRYIDPITNLNPIHTDISSQQLISKPEFTQIPIGINPMPIEYNGAIDCNVKKNNYVPLLPDKYDIYPKKFIADYDTITGFVDEKMAKYNEKRQEIVNDAYATAYQNKNTIMEEVNRDVINIGEDASGYLGMGDY